MPWPFWCHGTGEERDEQVETSGRVTTTHLLGTVFSLLPQLARCFLDLGSKTRLQRCKFRQHRWSYSNTHPDQSVSGLKLLLRCLIIVDQCKASAPSTTKLGLETKADDPVLVGFVETGELFGEISSRHVGSAGVEDVDNELTAGKEAVGDELACAEGDGC